MSNPVLDIKLSRLYGSLPDLRTKAERERYRELVFKRNQARIALREQRNWRRIDRINESLSQPLPRILMRQAD